MFYELHCHTDEGSNLRLLDTTNKVKTVMNYAAEIGLGGVAITDHESLSAHINALNHLAKVKEKHPDFKLILGNEIYLIDEADYQNTDKFYHFILLAKDKIGHRQLRELSTRAWERSYVHKGMERVPTFKEDLVEVIKENPGHLIASTACLGGEYPNIVAEGDVPKSIEFCDFFFQLFGDDFYIELQPGISNEQVNFNVKAMKFCKHFNYPWIITNDVHYLNPEKRELHTAFLNAKDGDRETADFYESTYFKTEEEMFKRMKFYLNEEDILKGFENTVEIAKKIEDYDLFQSTIVPQRELPEFEVQHLFKSWYDECPSLKYCAYSPYEQDRFLVSECERGAYNRGKNVNEELAKRLDVELEQILGISEKLNQRLSSYYNLDQLVVQLMWQVSFVGPARGSAAGFEICYLLGITQVDPMEWDLPYWRHLSKFRPELPDIDSDTEAAKRPDVFKTIIGHFGRDRCLNIATFRKETAKSAMLTACRGLGIDIDDARELASMIPMVRGKVYSIDECINGCEDNGYVPVSGFESKVLSYPNLLETVKEIEGLVSGRGVHASGLYIFSQPFVEQNSLMKAPNGTWTTCWNMGNSDQCGALKIDCLTVESLDRIHKCIDLLIEDGLIEDKGSIRENYDAYISPEVLDYDASEMWDAAGNDEICDLFQMATTVGREAMVKIKPRSLKQVSVSSSVMRLMGNEDMIPIDRYASFIQDINLWYQEMKDAGLNEDEVKVLEKHLLSNNGASIEQEDLMTLLMDEKISGFDIVWSNRARKGLAKRDRNLIEQVSKKYYEDGEKLGTRKQMLDYVWKYCLKPQLG